MIRLYREVESVQADAIEAEFRELVLGFERVVVTPVQAEAMFAGRALPVITNYERVVSGEEIPSYIKELTRLMYEWQLFQSDACYVREDGDGVC
jgi:hypothetical protein